MSYRFPVYRSIAALLIASCATTLHAQETETTATASIVSPNPSPAPRKATYTACNVDKPYIAITFDDGPHGALTPKLLDMLKERKIKATFFVVGTCAAEYPDIIKRIHDEGHELANHSWNHTNLAKLSTDGVRSQIQKTNDIVEKTTGVKMTLLRPPYGSFREAQRQWAVTEMGMPSILWAVDPMDWRDRSSSLVRDRIVSNTKAGDIILCHDIHATTVNAMPSTLDQLTARGFQFVTCSELIAMDKPVEKPTPVAKSSPAASETTRNKEKGEEPASPSASPEASPTKHRQVTR